MKTIQELLIIAKEKGIKSSFLNTLINGYRGKITDAKNGKTTLSSEELSIIENYLLGTETRNSSDKKDEFENKILLLARNKGKQLDQKDKEKLIKIFENTLDTFLDSTDK